MKIISEYNGNKIYSIDVQQMGLRDGIDEIRYFTFDRVGNVIQSAAVKNMKDIEVSCTIEEIQVIFHIVLGYVCSIRPDQQRE